MNKTLYATILCIGVVLAFSQVAPIDLWATAIHIDTGPFHGVDPVAIKRPH